MTVYTIRSNTSFSIVKNNRIYIAGDSVDLTEQEFELNKHKLEGVGQSYESIKFKSTGYSSFKSVPVSYINGALIVFSHGWTDFDPSRDWFIVQPWAICTAPQSGWNVGEIALLNGRRSTLEVTATNVKLQVGASSISIGRKDGNLNEFNLRPNSWQIFVTGIRKE